MIWLFDIDGTLIHTAGAGSSAMAQALSAAFGVPADLTEIRFAGRTDRGIIEDLFRIHRIEFTSSNFAVFHHAYLERLPAALRARDGQILTGVVHWLDRIEARLSASALGLLTGNMGASARLKLEHFGIWHRFAFGGYGDLHVHRNDVAAEALRAAGAHRNCPVRPEQVWVVGDTPHDIECARSQGANVIAVATGGHSAEELAMHSPDILLQDLSCVAVLDRLLPS